MEEYSRKRLDPGATVKCLKNVQTHEHLAPYVMHFLCFVAGSRYLVSDPDVIVDENGYGHTWDSRLFNEYFEL